MPPFSCQNEPMATDEVGTGMWYKTQSAGARNYPLLPIIPGQVCALFSDVDGPDEVLPILPFGRIAGATRCFCKFVLS